MTIRIEKHIPPPVVQPPVTYDIMGLSYNQATLIRDLLGKVSLSDAFIDSKVIYDALYHGLPGVGEDWELRVRASGIKADGTEGISVIQVNPLG